MLPPGLSMLWETTDAPTALRERFGLDGFDEAAQWLTKVLAEIWAVNVDQCDRIVISDQNAIAWVRTDRGDLVAKWSRAEHRFAHLAATADLIHAVHEQGIPVAAPLAALDGSRRVIVGSSSLPLSMTLQPTMHGELLDTTDADAVRTAGAWLARLHDALAQYADNRLLASVGRPGADLRGRVTTWLDQEDAGRAPEASRRLREQLSDLGPLDVEPQLIHNDYRSSNVLTRGSEVIAVLDFDEVARGHRVSDLANSLVLLTTRFTGWGPTPAPVRRTFLDGYLSVRSLTSLEQGWLDALVLWRGITAIPAGDDPTGWAEAL